MKIKKITLLNVGVFAIGAPVALVVSCASNSNSTENASNVVPSNFLNIVTNDGVVDSTLANFDGWTIDVVEVNSSQVIEALSVGQEYRIRLSLENGYIVPSEFNSSLFTVDESNPNIYYLTNTFTFFKKAASLLTDNILSFNQETQNVDVVALEGWNLNVFDPQDNEILDIQSLELGDGYYLKLSLQDNYEVSEIASNYWILEVAGATVYVNSTGVRGLSINASEIPESINFDFSNGINSISAPQYEGWIITTHRIGSSDTIDPSDLEVGSQYYFSVTLDNNYQANIDQIILLGNYERTSSSSFRTGIIILTQDAAILDQNFEIQYFASEFQLPLFAGWEVEAFDAGNNLITDLSQITNNSQYYLTFTLLNGWNFISANSNLQTITEGSEYRTSLIDFRFAENLPSGIKLQIDSSTGNPTLPRFEGWTTSLFDENDNLITNPTDDLAIDDNYYLQFEIISGYELQEIASDLMMVNDTTFKTGNLVYQTKAVVLGSSDTSLIWNPELERYETPNLEGWDVSVFNDSDIEITNLTSLANGATYYLKYKLQTFYEFQSIDIGAGFETIVNNSEYNGPDSILSYQSSTNLTNDLGLIFDTETETWSLPSLLGWSVQVFDTTTNLQISDLSNLTPNQNYYLQFTLKDFYTYNSSNIGDQLTEVMNSDPEMFQLSNLTFVESVARLENNFNLDYDLEQNKLFVPILEGWDIEIIHVSSGNSVEPSEIFPQTAYVFSFTPLSGYEIKTTEQIGSDYSLQNDNSYRNTSAIYFQFAELLTYSETSSQIPEIEGWIVRAFDSSDSSLSPSEFENLDPGSRYYFQFTLSGTFLFNGINSSLTFSEVIEKYQYRSSLLTKQNFIEIPYLDDIILFDGMVNPNAQVSGLNISIINTENTSPRTGRLNFKDSYRLKFEITNSDYILPENAIIEQRFNPENFYDYEPGLVQDPNDSSIYYSNVLRFSLLYLPFNILEALVVNTSANSDFKFISDAVLAYQSQLSMVDGFGGQSLSFVNAQSQWLLQPIGAEFLGIRTVLAFWEESYNSTIEFIQNNINTIKVLSFAKVFSLGDTKLTWDTDNSEWNIPTFDGWDTFIVDANGNAISESSLTSGGGQNYHLEFRLKEGYINITEMYGTQLTTSLNAPSLINGHEYATLGLEFSSSYEDLTEIGEDKDKYRSGELTT